MYHDAEYSELGEFGEELTVKFTKLAVDTRLIELAAKELRIYGDESLTVQDVVGGLVNSLLFEWLADRQSLSNEGGDNGRSV